MSSRGQSTRGGLPAWGLREGLITPRLKKKTSSYEMEHKAANLAGSCEHGNEPSGFVKGGEFLTRVAIRLLRRYTALWN